LVAPQPNVGRDRLVLVLDRSGSMAGSPFKAVLRALQTMEKLLAGLDLEVTMVFFNHMTHVVRLGPGETPYEEAAKVDPRYQTNFQVALDAIRASVVMEPHDRVRVLFMTDGLANRGDSDRGLSDFKAWASKREDTVVSVDVMAFQTTDNVAFLDRVRCAGSCEGIYRFCKQSAELEEMLGEIFSMIGARNTAITELALELPAGCKPIGTASCNGVPAGWPASDDGRSVDVGLWVRFAGGAPPDGGIAVVANGQVVPVEVAHQRTHRGASHGDRASGRSPAFRVYLHFVERKIFEFCQPDRVKAPSMEEAQAMQDMLKACHLVFRDKRVTKQAREELLEWRSDVQARLDKLHSLIQVGARGAAAADNAVISEMSSLRFDGAVKSARRQRALHQRVAVNAAAAGDIEGKLKELAMGGPPGDLPADEELRDFYQCSMTFADLPEIMMESDDDVIGFALSVQRPEEVVDAPSLIRVHGVSTTLLTRSALLDAIKYKIDATNQLTVHGGYGVDGDIGVATVGRSREPINAWLPLYVCESHWRRVRLLIKPMLGFFCCMDPLAYAENQYNSLLLVLGTMAMRSSAESFGERELRLLVAFRRTCRAIFEDIGWLGEKVHDLLTDFVKDPGCRLKHVVTSLVALIGALFVADPAVAQAAIDAGFWEFVDMESVRRGCGVLLKSMSDASVTELQQRLLLGGSAGADEMSPDEVDKAWVDLTASRKGTAQRDTSAPWEVAGDGTAPARPPVGGPAISKAKIPRSLRESFEVCGHYKLGTIPGSADAAASKQARAEEKCRGWWDGQLDAARKHVLGFEDGDAAAVDAGGPIELKVTRGSVSTVRDLMHRVRRVVYPSGVGVRACAVLHGQLEDLPPTADATGAVGELLGCVKRNAREQGLVGLEGMAWKARGAAKPAFEWLQAALVQCVSNHRNKEARAKCGHGMWAEVTSPDFVTAACAPIVDELTRRAETEADGMALAVLMQRANAVLSMVSSVEAFVGLLAMAHPDGRGEYYPELMARIADPAAMVPARAAKVEVLITGRYNGKAVFAAGNPCLPRGAQKAELEAALGLDVVTAIFVSTASRECMAWAYRETDIPNRHGHHNSNPHRKCFCRGCLQVHRWQQ